MFKTPSAIPQDLLLIHELVGQIKPPENVKQTGIHAQASTHDSDIASSDSDADDEVEVEADLVLKDGTYLGLAKIPTHPSPETQTDSESSDSDSDSEIDPEDGLSSCHAKIDMDEDEDEDSGTAIAAVAGPLRTQNEVPDPTVVVPDITEVGPEEVLEQVGEIMTIIEDVVIVKGCASEFAGRSAERALDSDSLLVFEDRRVLGYVYETFGPTQQPLYQIKFSSAFPLDRDLVKLKKLRGSDASNVHDEEVADYELEFSDDEAEAAYKRDRERRRADAREARRDGSVSSSRFSTPVPPQMRDPGIVDDDMYGTSPYDDNYMDIGPRSSRPAPTPYDDPYQSEPPLLHSTLASSSADEGQREFSPGARGSRRGSGRGRGRDSNNRGRNDRDHRGRGRDRGRGRGRGRGSGGGQSLGHESENSYQMPHGFDVPLPHPLSPTSLAIARATGQYNAMPIFAASGTFAPPSCQASSPGNWVYPHPSNAYAAGPQDAYGAASYQQPFIQPHINPRFFAMHVPYAGMPGQYAPHGESALQTNHQWDGAQAGRAGSGTDEYVVSLQDEEYRP